MSAPRQLDPLAAAEAFALTNAAVRGVFVGFSGATVWKLDDGLLQFALKVYPTDWNDARRLMEIHRWVVRAGADLMPQPRPSRFSSTVIESQGRLWELMDWRDGVPATDISDALESVARLHVVWQRPMIADLPCPTASRQWAVLDEWQEANVAPGIADELLQATSLLARLMTPTRDALRAWLNRPVPVQMVHGDLWAGNVLMHGGRVNGIIDCATVRVDSVASDLARLCGTVSADIAQSIADRYEPIRCLQPVEWELLKTLGRTGPVARLAQWLKWLVVEHRPFADMPSAGQRFTTILAEAQQLA